ncbi:MAG: hypothetical protein ABSE28_12685 [Candidatus Sulfotelmatobacter sp.]|jgi:hypothetical protein
MRPRILLSILITALFVIMSGCGTTPNCPTCGTTINGAYAVINTIPVPEHNATGEPGGPFNSFDISTIAPNPAVSGHYLDYISDRIGLVMQVIDTSQDVAVFSIQGSNAVAGAGNGASGCAQIPATNTTSALDIIPPVIDVFGNFTRFGCRSDMSTATPPGPTFHLITGFGANHNFGGFPGAQCCAARGNGVNPMSGPDGNTTTPDGKILFVGNGSSSVVVFDLTTMNLGTNPPTPPTVLAVIPTGVSADYDGPTGIAGCVASWNGEAGSATDCGDDRADEMAYDPTHQVLSVINGDPGLPFVTFIDMSNIVNKTGTLAQQHCLPIDSTLAYGPYPPGYAAGSYLGAPYPLQGSGTGLPPSLQLDPGVGGSFNPPSCIIGQIYYDGVGGPGNLLNPSTPVDTLGGTVPCPDPSNPHVFSGVSGSAADVAAGLPGVGTTPSGTAYTIPCHHGPILDYTSGAFCSLTSPASTCAGAISPAGLGGMTYNSNSGFWLLSNGNSTATTNIGSVDVIDLQLGTGNGPVVVNSFVMPNCMPTGIVQGPGNNFLVGCADHDGEAFPPNEYVIDGTAGTILATINQVGGVDETWYNPGDNKYYLAARDMPTGPVMGVIDAKTNQWLANVTTNTNSHSIAVDPSTNHAFVPMQAGGICGTQSSNGCVGVIAEQ